jgi:prenyltransferase beta subunit
VRRLVYLLAVLVLSLAFAPVFAQQNTAAVDQAVAYIRSQQQDDGSFAGLGPGSTADAVYALVAAGQNVAEVTKNGKSAIDYMRSQKEAAAKDPGLAAKLLIAMLLAGQSSEDLVSVVERSYDQATGRYGSDVSVHAYALIALRAAGQPIKPEAVDALKQLQLPDGGWSYDGTEATGSDTNTTALAVQALVATGDASDVVSRAIRFYRAQQNPDAGFPYSQASEFGADSDANSTALSIQALIAAGEDIDAWTQNGRTPLERLAAFQNDSGAFRYSDAQPEDNAFATYQAVPALVKQTLPLEPIAVAQTTPANNTAGLPGTGVEDLLAVYIMLAAVLLGIGSFLRRRWA